MARHYFKFAFLHYFSENFLLNWRFHFAIVLHSQLGASLLLAGVDGSRAHQLRSAGPVYYLY